MSEISQGLAEAFRLIISFDAALMKIIGLSLWVSGVAIFLASLIALPLGTLLGRASFPGRSFLIIIMNAMMGLPPVVVGLILYLLISRSGPFGVLDLLYSPTAMIIAQIVLAVPIITSIARQIVSDAWAEYRDMLISLGAGPIRQVLTLLWETRFALATAVLTGFGRIIGEVGAVMIVGGNIENFTRVLTTVIAMETRKGNIGLAIGLGLVLILIAVAVNIAMYVFSRKGSVRA